MPRSLADRLRVCVIADPEQTDRDIVEIVRLSLAGGATAIQLRAKALVDRDVFELAQRIEPLCAERGALFILNDRLDLALATGAAGVHLGVDDLPIAAARSIAGDSFVIGYSPETDEQAASAGGLGASYLGVGPAYTTGSKHDAGAPIGPVMIGQRAQLSGLPTIGVGGLTADRVDQVIAAGACGIAVIGAVLRSNDPLTTTTELVRAVNTALDRYQHVVR